MTSIGKRKIALKNAEKLRLVERLIRKMSEKCSIVLLMMQTN